MLWEYRRAIGWIRRDSSEGIKGFAEEVNSKLKEVKKYFWTKNKRYKRKKYKSAIYVQRMAV